jgi:hypothetical protein
MITAKGNDSLEKTGSATYERDKYWKIFDVPFCTHNSNMAAINIHLFVPQVQARIRFFFFCGIFERNIYLRDAFSDIIIVRESSEW